MRLTAAAASILGLAVGLVLWAADRGYCGITLDKHLKPVEVAGLAVTIFIAFFLQYFLVSKAGETRAEKDFLIETVRGAIKDLRACRDVVSSSYGSPGMSEPNKKAVLGYMRRISNELENIETAVEASSLRDLTPRCEALKLLYFSYKRSATGGNFPSKAYSTLQISDQAHAFRSLHQALQSLVFEINAHR